MAGLFDPSMFPNAMGSNAPQMGLLARLAGMINQPTGLGAGFPPQPTQQQPGADAMASALVPAQGPSPAQSAAPMSPPLGLPPMGQNAGTLSSMFGNADGSGILNGIHGFLSAHQNALQGLGAGIASGGLQRGVPGMAQGAQQDYQLNMQRNSLAGTYQALIASGVPPAQAQAMTLNPELLKTMAPTYMAKPTWGKVATDAMGHDIMGFIDTNKGTVTRPDGMPGTSSTGADPQYDENGKDEGFLKTLDPITQAAVKGIVAGDVPASGRNMQQLLPLAARYQNGFTAQDYATRLKTRNAYLTGPQGQELKAVNTAIGHADALQKASDQLGGSDTMPALLNPIVQGTKNQFPQIDPNFQTAQKKWDATSETLATEVSKALNGGTPHVADKEHWRSILQGANGPTQRQAAISSIMDILQKRTEASAANYNQGMGTAREPISFIDPDKQPLFNKLTGQGDQTQAAAATPGTQAAQPTQSIPEGSTATHAKTGQKIVFKGGQWVPAGAAQ